jgi:hypothetical protein
MLHKNKRFVHIFLALKVSTETIWLSWNITGRILQVVSLPTFLHIKKSFASANVRNTESGTATLIHLSESQYICSQNSGGKNNPG